MNMPDFNSKSTSLHHSTIPSPQFLFTPVLFFLGGLLEIVFTDDFELGTAVFAGNDFTFLSIGFKGNAGATNRTFSHFISSVSLFSYIGIGI
jgi:hypothetical protein